MFFGAIPLGNDQGIFHYPRVTIGIIATCFLIQLVASISINHLDPGTLERDMLAVEREAWHEFGAAWLMEKRRELTGDRADPEPEIEESYEEVMDAEGNVQWGGYDDFEDDEEVLSGYQRTRQAIQELTNIQGLRAEFIEAFQNGELCGEEDPIYYRWSQLKRDHERLEAFISFAYHPIGSAYTLITHIFLHGGWLHLIGNMIFLWSCGVNIEDRWGPLRWALLYLAGGCVAAITWGSMHFTAGMPLVGASGAIAAAMGAFLVIFYKAKIRIGYFLVVVLKPYFGVTDVRAFIVLPFWFAWQLFDMLFFEEHSNVAYSAHVAGFGFGVVAAITLKVMGWDKQLVAVREQKATLFAEHPLYLRASSAQSNQDFDTARIALEELLAKVPDHVEGAVDLFRIALTDGDPSAIGVAASHAIANAKKAKRPAIIRDIATELQRRAPQVKLSERHLIQVATAFTEDDPRRAAETYQCIAQDYPSSPFAPKGLLEAARIYDGKLRDYDAAEMMRRLLQRDYPDSVYAEQAQG